MIVGTLLPSDQDGGFFQGDLNLHASIISETAQEIHEKYGFVSCQPYTTNSIESLNYQLRKVSKNRGHFPNDTAAVKLLWLAICNIEDKRALERERDRGKPAGKRRAKPRLVEGQTTTNWKQALAQLTTAYPDRINPYL